MRNALPSAKDLLRDHSKSFVAINLRTLAENCKEDQIEGIQGAKVTKSQESEQTKFFGVEQEDQSDCGKDKKLMHLKMVELIREIKSKFLNEYKIEYLKENHSLDGFDPNSYDLDQIDVVKDLQSAVYANQNLDEKEFRNKYSHDEAIKLISKLNSTIEKTKVFKIDQEKLLEPIFTDWKENKKQLVAKLIEKMKAVKSSLICDFKINYLERNGSLTGFDSSSIDFNSLEPIKNLKIKIASNSSMDKDAFNCKFGIISTQFAILDEEIKKLKEKTLEKEKIIQEKILKRDMLSEPDPYCMIDKKDLEAEVAKEAKKILDTIISNGLKLIEEKTRKEAEEKDKQAREINETVKTIINKIVEESFKIAIRKAKEIRRLEFEEKHQKELDKNAKIQEEKAKREAELQAQQQEIEKQIKQQQIEKIKDKILEKTSANFKKFQPFFDYLREVKWLGIEEVGLFGSRVYREVIDEACPSMEISKNPQADLDFYCISGGLSSNGIFAFCHEESASRDNFQEVIEIFNKKNPNLQISFLEDKDGGKIVNFNGSKKSLNFKLVATFLEDEVDEEKTEKTFKEKVEFDLSFYTKQSILENLQWQFNLERVILSQNPDKTFILKINHCNCDPSQEKMTVDDFFAKAQGEEMREFLFESNPQARGFLNRMINQKGIYKYLDEETLNALKYGLLEDEYIKENLKKELLFYKKIIDEKSIKASGSTKSKIDDEKFTQAKFILDEIAKDKIFKEDEDFKEILQSSPRGSPARANVDSKSIVKNLFI